MLLADVSTQYGSSIPATKFAKIDSASNGEKEMPVTVDTSTAKHGSLPLFLTSEFRGAFSLLWLSCLHFANLTSGYTLMFVAETYHMLDSSDNDIASW